MGRGERREAKREKNCEVGGGKKKGGRERWAGMGGRRNWKEAKEVRHSPLPRWCMNDSLDVHSVHQESYVVQEPYIYFHRSGW